MKKLMTVLLAVVMLAAIVAVPASAVAFDENFCDMRQAQDFGQYHWYMGAPATAATAPNSEDATIDEGEYGFSLNIGEASVGHVRDWSMNGAIKPDDQGETNNYYTDSNYMFYMSYDDNYIYAAFSKVDPDFVPAAPREGQTLGATIGCTTGDGFRLSLNSKPNSADQWNFISRIFFDIHFDEDAEPVFDIWASNFTGKGQGPKTLFDTEEKRATLIAKSSGSYDEATDLLTVEFAIKRDTYLDFWSAEDLDWAGMILKVHRFGPNEDGSKQNANQGRLDLAFDYCIMDNEDGDLQFWHNQHFAEEFGSFSWRGHNVVHFHEEGNNGDCPLHYVAPEDDEDDPITPPAGGDDTDDTPTTPTQPAKTDAPKTEAPKTEAPKTNEGGCGGAMALAALAVVPALAVAFVAKKRED